MPTPLKLLMVEDSADDAELLLYTLRRGGYEVTWQRVDTPEAMRAALQADTWDIITSDHAMPRFSAPAALKLARELRPAIPLIIVSGEIDLNLAVSLMRGGAQDYIQKGELARVVPAIERELHETDYRRRQRQTEEALNRQQQLMAQIYDTSPVGIAMVDASGQITFANREAERVLGLTKDDITQLTYNAPEWCITAFDGGPFPESDLPFARVMRTGQPVRDVRHAIEWPDGRRVLLSINAAPLTDDSGTLTGIVATLHDITGQMQVAESLRESEGRFRTLVNSMDDVIFTLDPQGRHTGVYGNWVERAGLTPDHFLGRSACEIVGDEVGCIHEQACQRAALGETVVYDWETPVADGSTLYYQTSLSPIYDGERVTGVVGVGRDVTALKRAKAALEADHAFRTAVIGSAAAGLCVCHNVPEYPFVQFTIWNERMTELTGYTLEEINRLGWYQTLYPDPQIRQQASERMDQMRTGNNLQHEEWPITAKDGRQKVIEISTSVVQTVENVTHVLALMNDVTERTRAEEALRVRQVQLSASLELTPYVAVQWYDLEGRVVYWNPASERIYGWTAQEALGKTLDQLLYTPAENAEFLENLRHIAATGQPVGPFESSYRHRDGRQGVILSTQFAIPSEGGQPLFACVDVDITQMKRAQQNLETLFNTLDDLLFVLDRQGCILHVNQTVCRTLGYAAEELCGQPVLVVHPEERRAEAAQVVAAVLAGEAETCLIPLQSKDGRLIPVETRVLLGEWDGQPALFGVTRDISALKLSEEKVARTFYSSPVVMAVSTIADGRYLDINDAFVKLTGYTRQEIIGNTSLALNLFVNPAERQQAQRLMAEKGILEGSEMQVRRKDGEILTGIFSASPITIGTEACWLTTILDITERKRTEQALHEAQKRYQDLVETAQDLIWQCDAEGRYTYLNPAWEAVLGYSPDEMLGRPFTDFQSPDMAERDMAEFAGLLAGGMVKGYETVHLHKDGRSVVLAFNAKFVRDEAGNILGTSGTAYDITERVRAGREAKHMQERLSAFFRLIPEMASVSKEGGRFIEVSDAFYDATGYTREDVFGENAAPIALWADFSQRDAVARLIAETGWVKDFPVMVRRKSGEIFPGLFSTTRLEIDGEFYQVTTVSDISRHVQAERALRESEEKYRLLVENQQELVVKVDTAGRFLYVSPSYCRAFGKTPDELIGNTYLPLVHEEDREVTQKAVASLYHPPHTCYIEQRALTSVGWRWLAWQDTAVLDEQGQVQAIIGVGRDITERKQAESEAQHLQERLSAFFRLVPEMASISRVSDGHFLEVSQAFTEITGYDREDFLDRSAHPIPLFADPAQHREIHRLMDAQGTVRNYPARLRKKTGEIMPILYSATVFEVGEEAYKIVVCTDISEQERTRQALQESEKSNREQARFLSTLLDAIPDIIGVQQAGTRRIVRYNAAGYQFLQCTPEQAIGACCFSLIGRSRPCEECATEQAYQTRLPAHIQKHLPEQDRWFDVGAYPVLDEQGEVQFVIEHLRDITEQKKAEAALRQSEERYRNLVEHSPDAIVVHCDGILQYVNPAALHLVRAQNAAQLVGQRAIHFVHPEDRAVAFERIRQMMTTGQPAPLADERFVRLDGSVVDVEVAAIPTTYDGKPAAQVIFREITRRKQAEIALLQSEQRFRRMFDEAPVGALLVSPHMEFLRVNRAFCQWLGYPEAELLQKNMAAITHPDDLPGSKEYVMALLEGRIEQFEMEKRYLRKDGQVVWGRVSVVLLRDETATPLYFLPMIQDITQAKQAEREIRQLNAELEQRVMRRTVQLEAANKELEAFTYSVSHDLRAPLRAIDGYSKILLDSMTVTVDEESQHYLTRLRESAQRMTQLVNDLLNLSRLSRAHITRTEVNLSQLAQALVDDLRESQPERAVQVRIQLDMVASADANLMRVVLDNLLRNAWKFTSKRPQAQIEFASRVEGGETVYFVRDNGAGFDMAYAEKLFVAFQRLHSEAEFEGTGIGLTIVQRIIHRHGGRVWAESAPEQGATFYFTLAG